MRGLRSQSITEIADVDENLILRIVNGNELNRLFKALPTSQIWLQFEMIHPGEKDAEFGLDSGSVCVGVFEPENQSRIVKYVNNNYSTRLYRWICFAAIDLDYLPILKRANMSTKRIKAGRSIENVDTNMSLEELKLAVISIQTNSSSLNDTSCFFIPSGTPLEKALFVKLALKSFRMQKSFIY